MSFLQIVYIEYLPMFFNPFLMMLNRFTDYNDITVFTSLLDYIGISQTLVGSYRIPFFCPSSGS